MEAADGLYLVVPMWGALVMANVAFMLNKTAFGIVWIIFAMIIWLFYVFLFLIPLRKHEEQIVENKIQPKQNKK